MKKVITLIAISFMYISPVFAQFGQNKVQYKDYTWYYVQTKHFDVYFSQQGRTSAWFATQVLEDALDSIQHNFDYKLNNRISVIIYDSHNDFAETNTTDEYLSQGVGGFTEPFKNRMVFPFEGDYEKFRHVIHHELVHAVMNDMLYGGTLQNIISKGISLQLPLWYSEGMAEYQSAHWETYEDMFIRDAIINDYLPDVNRLGGYFAYRGGQALMHYIAKTYGEEKIGEILHKTKTLGSLEAGIKASIGLSIEELNDRWKKDLKKTYYPGVALHDDPDIFAKRLTENKKDGGFYNMSPALSPQGDKIAFISDRDIFLDVYIMDASTGKIIDKVVESGKTNDFEELNLLLPSLTWAPDNKRIALSLKSGGFDVITIIDTETGDKYELPFKMDGIQSVSWSHDGSKLAFIGANAKQSDVYIYDFNTKQVEDLTDDIFTDSDPSWSADNESVLFASDRGKYVSKDMIDNDFNIFDHDFHHLDLYMVNIKTKKMDRLTDWKDSNERFPVASPDGLQILFVSDKSGISNIYKKRIVLKNSDHTKSLVDIPAYPITNSLYELTQLSTSADGKKLAFTSLYNYGYNIFTLNNPFDMKLSVNELKPTHYMAAVTGQVDSSADKLPYVIIENNNDTTATSQNQKPDSTSSTEIFTGQYYAKKDTTKKSGAEQDYSKYVFGDYEIQKIDSAEIAKKRSELFKETLDTNGNYLVHRYKTNFSPDLVYANAGYSSYYGLLGTTILSFSDMLGNHRLIGITSLQIDLKNSDYGLAYYYLKSRTNYGIEAFHTARFVYLSGFLSSELYRFRSFGAVGSISYPLDRFYRVEGSLSLLNVTADNLDNLAVPSSQSTFVIPSIGFVHDNTLYGYTAPIEGTRYSLNLFGNPGFNNSRQSFYSFTWDFRTYYRFWFDNSFVFRLSGGYSAGANPQRFFLGGTENWINRTFRTGDIPLNSPADFAFLSPALPLRGYDYAEQIGNKYSLLNLELRMPVIRYLVTGPLPILLQNILGAAFIDMGSAWNDNSQLKLFQRDGNGDLRTQDLLIGTGTGIRAYLFFLWRVDVAWTYDMQNFSKPRYYLSIGLDF